MSVDHDESHVQMGRATIEIEKMREEMCALCLEVFEHNPSGKRLFGMFKEILTYPVLGMDESEAVGRTREGRNMFIREIIRMIEIHKQIIGEKAKEQSNG